MISPLAAPVSPCAPMSARTGQRNSVGPSRSTAFLFMFTATSTRHASRPSERQSSSVSLNALPMREVWHGECGSWVANSWTRGRI